MADIATLGIAVRSEQVDRANDSLARLSGAAAEAERSTKRLGTEAKRAGGAAQAANDNAARSASNAATAYGKWERAATMVGRAVGAIAGALATGAFVRYADAWSDMQSRVGAAIRDMEAAPAMMQRLVDIANASYSPLDQTVEVYSRNVSVLRDLGRGATEAADFTEALNHALVITATRGERAASVQNALSKAMAVGKLQADGLETVLANGGAVAEALAAELGTTVNGLRQMATDGRITGDVIANSLITRLGDLRDRAAEMPATVEDAMVRLQTNMTAFIGGLDQATGASAFLSSAIMLVANNIDTIARVAAVAGVALLTAFAPAILAAMASGLVAIGTAGVAAMTAITVAIAANPLGALAVAIATVITAVYLFRDEISQAIGVDVVGITKTAANFIIGALVGAYDAVMATWQMWPAALGDLGYQAANKFLEAVVWMAREAVSIINGLVASINGALRGAGVDIQLPDLGAPVKTVPSMGVTNPYAGTRAGVGDAASNAMSAAMSVDYIGSAGAAQDLADAIGGVNGGLNELGDGSGGGGSAGGGGGGAAKKTADGLKKIKDETLKAAQAAADFAKGVTKGFITDLRQGLQNGEGFFRSFANAALNALDKVVDKLLDDVLSAIFTVNSAGSAGGGGGFLGGILGSIGKLFGFAEGGYTGNGSKYQPAGIVHAGEYVFSKAATAKIGVGNLDRAHRAAKGYAGGGFVTTAPANSNGGGPVEVHVTVGWSRTADGNLKPFVENVSQSVVKKATPQIVGASVSQANENVMPTVSRHQNDVAGGEWRLG